MVVSNNKYSGLEILKCCVGQIDIISNNNQNKIHNSEQLEAVFLVKRLFLY
jgi:hypothetical protein